MNVIGKISVKPTPFAASGEETLIPISAKIHENAKPNSSSRPMPARISGTRRVEAEADDQPGREQDHDRQQVRRDVGQRAAGEHRRARRRQRAEAVDQALGHVLGQPERGREPAERDLLDDHPRDQEVDVVVVAGRRDRAAEDVREQQHEHDRLDREGRAACPGCAGAARGCAPPSRACRGSCRHLHQLGARRLRLGRVAGERQEHVVERRRGGPRGPRRRRPRGEPPRGLHDRAVALARPCTRTSAPSACGGSSLMPSSAAIAANAAASCVSVTSTRCAADARLELVGRALGDHAAVVDRPRCGRPAGRPPRGTASSAARSCRRRRGPRSSPTGRSASAGPGPSSARRGTAPAGARRAPPRGPAGAACRRE